MADVMSKSQDRVEMSRRPSKRLRRRRQTSPDARMTMVSFGSRLRSSIDSSIMFTDNNFLFAGFSNFNGGGAHSDTIKVETAKVGRIVGSKGATINQLQDDHKVKIDIGKEDDMVRN